MSAWVFFWVWTFFWDLGVVEIVVVVLLVVGEFIVRWGIVIVIAMSFEPSEMLMLWLIC